MRLRKGYVIPDDPYFEPIVVISKWVNTRQSYHSPYSARNHVTGELVQAKTLESLYQKLAYRARKEEKNGT
jgi:hypothetical protein